jgi:hypothetical protein
MPYRFLPVTLLLLLAAACTAPQVAVNNAPPGAAPPAATPAATASPVATPCNFATADRGNCAWQLFVQLNSPTNATGPKSWETSYRSSETVYLPTGCPPPSWGQTTTPPATVQQQAQQLPGYAQGSVIHNLGDVNKFQVDGLVLKDKWGGSVLYQILMNQDTFNYIVQRALYNVEGQEQAAKDNKPANFPATSFELKTSWIWLGNDQAKYNELVKTYYIVPAYYEKVVNGKSQGYVVGNAALAGMHIINKQQPDWIWMTFENVNNPTYTQAKLELPIPDYAVQANKTYQQQLQGSVFANYQLDGVQLAFEDPKLMANSTIESAFQKESSCMTCHAVAAVKPDGSYFNLVNKQGGNVAYYTGQPPDMTGWTTLDFVWSLKRASRRNNNVCTQ